MYIYIHAVVSVSINIPFNFYFLYSCLTAEHNSTKLHLSAYTKVSVYLANSTILGLYQESKVHHMIFDRNLNSADLLLARPFFIFINFYVLFCHTLLRLSFSCNHDDKHISHIKCIPH